MNKVNTIELVPNHCTGGGRFQGNIRARHKPSTVGAQAHNQWKGRIKYRGATQYRQISSGANYVRRSCPGRDHVPARAERGACAVNGRG